MTTTVWETEILQEYIENNNLDLVRMFVDVGAGDGEHQSNSLSFIEQGYEALLIDGIQSNIDKCKRLHLGRPFVKCICALVSDEVENVYFEEDKRHWALSSIKEGTPNRTTTKLSTILKEKAIKEIGILSLDIEGNEAGVLRDLMQHKIYPQLIIVEGNTFEAMQEHRDILELHYKFVAGVFPNQIFKILEK